MAKNDPNRRAGSAILKSRPGGAVTAAAPTGMQALDTRGERASMLYVPASYRPDRAAPLILALHGATGRGERMSTTMQRFADQYGAILLAPTSQAATWDSSAERRFGTDIKVIDGLLGQVFAKYAVDPNRIAVAGFSDGASYALSVGLSNGDMFRHVIAFSPGYMAPTRKQGEPRIFIAHGTNDPVLQIERTGRAIAQRLVDDGRKVNFVEFPGGHAVPTEIAEQAMTWLFAPGT